MSEYLEFFTIEKWTILFTWVNMFLLFWILKKLLFKPVMGIITKRQQEVSKIYDEAAQANKNAVAMEKEYTEKLAFAKDEAGEIVKQATITARKREDEIIREAKEKATAMTKHATMEIEQEKKKAYQEIKVEISDISVAIAEKMVQREITAKDHEALIAQFIENVGEAK